MESQSEINKQLWQICDNFKKKTEIKKNYIVYISALLFIRYYDEKSEEDFKRLYQNRNNYYIGDAIDGCIERIEKDEHDKNIFSNIKFKGIKIYRDTGEENVIGKTIEAIYFLSYKNSNKKGIAEAYEYILEQAVYRNDIIKDVGEFYTPKEITQIMSNLIINEESTNVYDPICGSGNFLKTALESNISQIYGKEDNLDYYNILKTRLLVNEINSDNIIYGEQYTNNSMKFDVIISNPPFADKTWKENKMLSEIMYKFKVPQTQVGDYIYVLSMLEKLDEDGNMAVILPHGVLFRESEKPVRRKLVENSYIKAIIGLPENLFYDTRIPVIIMVLSKKKKEEDILFIDASQEYESDRKNNIMSKEHQDKIVRVYKKKEDIENYSHLASKEDVINNEFDLTIKKYIKKERKVEVVNREELIKDVKRLKLEQERLEENIKDVLEVLGYQDIGEEPIIEKEKHNTQSNQKRFYNIDAISIGEKIKEERRKKEITLEEMAEKLNTSVTFICRIERGASYMNLQRVIQICEILDISIEELLLEDRSKINI
ncbi:MAG: N-6 DNA methylase [Clostridia bacterium]|jgi:type I restriction enzyme M protein|nr:N-6 DNA methylase [Clostridia bacterium]